MLYCAASRKYKTGKMIFILLLLLIPHTPAAQEIVEEIVQITQQPQSSENTDAELGELKIKYLVGAIQPDELYRLASFYLSRGFYQQAAELYGQFLESGDDNYPRIVSAHYNRALALFSSDVYDSAADEFLTAYYFDDSLYDALRMAGTIYFLQKKKEQSLSVWEDYLAKNTAPSPERDAIENAVKLII